MAAPLRPSSAVMVLIVAAALANWWVVESEPTQDKQALLAFLSQTPHANRLQWNASASACSWVGVICDATGSYVDTLRLPGVGLFGQIPANTLGRLSQLRVLSLRSNKLSGPRPRHALSRATAQHLSRRPLTPSQAAAGSASSATGTPPPQPPLERLRLRSNKLSGPVPSDFANLTLLRNLYLQDNAFSGEFPAVLTQLTRLVRLDLSSNNFSGEIPFSVNNLTRLTGLFLQDNQLSGALPSINADGRLDAFNVSDNRLNGSIPAGLSQFPASSFAGNLALCGGPLPPCNPFFPSPAPAPSNPIPPTPVKTKSKKLSTAAIIAIAVGATVIGFLLLLLLILCIRRRRRQPTKTPKPAVPAGAAATARSFEAGTSSSKDDIIGASTEAERNKLVFFGEGVYSFDLEDLLRASAEVLGKGSVGTSYKAVLEEGTTVVVKRLKDVAVTKKDFEAQLDALGNIKHDNVVPLRAFYFSKDEKLLVSDYFAAGSLSALLHGSRGSGRTPLDWDSRLKIAIGAGRGLAHLHESGRVIHGNIKSSNILLGPDQSGHLSDFGLNPLFGTSAPPNRIAGYRAPEVLETQKSTFKSDVYSFGVLLLELLTGKAPNQASLGEEGIDLPRWVQSVVREEWTAEVFDVELMRYHNIEEEMVQLLQIAMSCVALVPDQRPTMPEVVRMMEDMNRGETTDDALRQSSDDPSKGSDSHTPTVGVTP